MNWNVIVRIGKNDNFYPAEIRNEPRFFVDFHRPNSPWKMREGVLQVLINEGIITPLAHDLLVLGMAITAADRCILRKYADDYWQRKITIHLPVSNPELWENSKEILIKALKFLSGDIWDFHFRKSSITIHPRPDLNRTNDICLFSGGLDSLVGAIDLLSEGKKITFVGHYSNGVTRSFQTELKAELEKLFPRQSKFNFHYIVPPKIEGCKYENTTRTRSFLFLSLASVYGSTSQDKVKLFVPENGLISLNVPLTKSRTGSLSTKTTHPYSIKLFNKLLNNLGINVEIITPYKFKTKGEMLIECKNRTLIKRIAKYSMSCSHPEQSRWQGESPRTHCGVCFPCLVRRAAFLKVNLLDANYVVDVLSNPPDHTKDSGSDYRAVIVGLTHFINNNPASDFFKVISTGPIPQEEVSSFVEVYRRGMNELSQFLLGKVRE
jgi:7-cyano-7-deazaguanine synthase in queuosine biosynthesis